MITIRRKDVIMRMTIGVSLAVLGVVLIVVGMGQGKGTVVCDQVLDQVRGGGWWCDGVSGQCATQESSGTCESVGGGYCADVVLRTFCTQWGQECVESPLPTGSCVTVTVPCEGSYWKCICVPVSAELCEWESIASYPCYAHPSGNTTKDGCIPD